jgi:hypothetical protein
MVSLAQPQLVRPAKGTPYPIYGVLLASSILPLPRYGVGPRDPVGPVDRLPPPVVRSRIPTNPDLSSTSPHGPHARLWVVCELLSQGERPPSHSTPTERTCSRPLTGRVFMWTFDQDATTFLVSS